MTALELVSGIGVLLLASIAWLLARRIRRKAAEVEAFNQALVAHMAERKRTEQELRDLNESLLGHIMERGRAERALEAEAERLAAIVATQQAVATGALDTTRIRSALVERVLALAGADAAAILELDGEELVLRAGSGTALAQLGFRTAADAGLAGHCLREGTVVRCDDAELDPRANPDTCRRLGLRSAVLLPLFQDGGAVGVLAVLAERPAAFSDRDLQALELAAGLLSAALGRAAAFEAKESLLVERTKALAALRESEERFRLLAGAAPLGIVQTDPLGRCLYANPRWHQIAGRAPEQSLGRSWLDAVHPEDREEVRAEWERSAGEGDEFSREFRFLRADGGDCWVASRAVALLAEGGRLEGYVGTVEDVTQRRQAEEELRSLTAALRNAAEGIAQLDPQGRFVVVNQAFAVMAGYEPWELIGTTWPGTVHPADRDTMLEAYRAMLAKGKVETEVRGLRKDGSSFHQQVVLVCAFDATHRFVGHHAFTKDITERKEAEQALRAAKEDAEAANRAKSQFLATMSHELRTPLNSVIGLAKVLLKNKAGTLGGREMGYLERIDANGQHLLSLIDEILDLAKIEAGRLDLELVPVDLAGLVAETLRQLEGQVRERPLALRAAVPEGLVPVVADRARLKQVLINLVGNAIKFTPAGSVTIRILAEGNRPFRIDVVDTGIGIDPARQDVIFQAFQQEDNSTARRFGGSGLGLAISRSLAELMHCRLTLQSTPGHGSTFSIVFPAPVPAAGAAA